MARISQTQAKEILHAYEKMKTVQELGDIQAHYKAVRVPIDDNVYNVIHWELDFDKIYLEMEMYQDGDCITTTRIIDINHVEISYGSLRVKSGWRSVFTLRIEEA